MREFTLDSRKGPPYKIWLAQTRVAREVGPCGDARVFGTSKVLSLRKLCEVTGRRGRRFLRRCVSFRNVEGAVHYGDVRDAGRRGRRPLRRCVSFRVAEDADSYGRRNLRWKLVTEDVDPCEMEHFWVAEDADSYGRRNLRWKLVTEDVDPYETVLIFGSPRMSIPKRWRGFLGCLGRRFLRDGAFSGRRGRRPPTRRY